MKNIIFIIIFILISSPVFAQTDFCATDSDILGCWLMEDTGNETDTSGVAGDGVETGGTIPRDSSKQVGSWSRDFEAGDTEWLQVNDGAWSTIGGANGMVSFGGWVNLESLGSTRYVMAKYTYSGSQYEYRMFIGSDNIATCAINDNGGTNFSSKATTVFSSSTWYHVMCVYDDVDVRIYINGTLEGTPTASTNGLAGTSSAWCIGVESCNAGPTNYFDGLIDDVCLFKDGLTSSEVTEIYTYGCDGTGGAEAFKTRIFF